LKNLFLFLLLITTFALNGQSSNVRFANIDLTAAKQRAVIEDKLIFIDTYASYCRACKKLEREFKDPKLAKFFNKHFINVRIDMETEAGQELKYNYQVVFLPTLLILDQHGNQKLKLDELVQAHELLSLAKFYQERSYPGTAPQPTYAKTKSTPVTRTVPAQKTVPAQQSTVAQKSKPVKRTEPVKVTRPSETTARPSTAVAQASPKKTTQVVKPQAEKDEKILYVVGQDGQELPPEILKKEAYFRMELMDGSHVQAAHKYLKTQDDWSSEKNMRFLFDFLYSANSKQFEYLTANRDAFNALKGKSIVDNTIDILVKKELERAHPRPDQQRAQELIALTKPLEAEHLAREYHLQSLYDEGNNEAFIKLGRKHIDKNCTNHKLLYELSSVMFEDANSKREIKESLSVSNSAVELETSNIDYLLLNGKIQYKLGNKESALLSVNNALKLARESNQATFEIETLLKSIQEL